MNNPNLDLMPALLASAAEYISPPKPRKEEPPSFDRHLRGADDNAASPPGLFAQGKISSPTVNSTARDEQPRHESNSLPQAQGSVDSQESESTEFAAHHEELPEQHGEEAALEPEVVNAILVAGSLAASEPGVELTLQDTQPQPKPSEIELAAKQPAVIQERPEIDALARKSSSSHNRGRLEPARQATPAPGEEVVLRPESLLSPDAIGSDALVDESSAEHVTQLSVADSTSSKLQQDSAQVGKPAGLKAEENTSNPALAHRLDEETADSVEQTAEYEVVGTTDDESTLAESHASDSDSRKRDSATKSTETGQVETVEPKPGSSARNMPIAGDAATTGSPIELVPNVSSSADSLKPEEAKPGQSEGMLSPLARFEQGRYAAHGSRRSLEAGSTIYVDPGRFVHRVARAIQTAQERGGPLQLRLSPPELGALRVELSLVQGALTATIETENSTTRQMLLEHLPALRERLAEQSVRIERFDVDVRRDGSESGGRHGQPNAGPQERSPQRHPDQTSPRGGLTRQLTTSPLGEESTPARRTITSTSINVVA